MKLLNINGIPRFKNCEKRRIVWDSESKSKFQKQVKQYLKQYWVRDVVYEEFYVYGTRYTLDFFNATKKIAVEVNGGFHHKFTPFFQKSEFDYLKQLKHDETKRKFCEINNIRLIEIFYNEKNSLSKEYFDKLDIS